MEYKDLTIKEIAEGIKSHKFTSESVVRYFIDRCKKYSNLNAVIEIFDDAIVKAQEIDKKIHDNQNVGTLAGVPIMIKDNILIKGKKMSCASKFMQDFVSPYSATIINKLEKEDAIMFARTNMDEFAMGGSCENSVYGPCRNFYDTTRVSGGSSGGSAVAVSAGLAPAAIGTDTGGSIRQPASFCGVVGMKPTYGTVSRYGIVAFASSTDQAGPITKNIDDSKFLLSVIAGKDRHDQTSISNSFSSVAIKTKYRIGVIKELSSVTKKCDSAIIFEKSIEKFKKLGHEIVEVSIPHIEESLACYYVLTPAEATSNLARFDGVKYTSRAADTKSLEEVYVKSRSNGFGQEVKRRIMLGNFVLSSGYFDAYYKKAKRLQDKLRVEFDKAFSDVDVIITPTTPSIAFKIGEKVNDPVKMYAEDLFTVPASITGVPALNICMGQYNGLPLGLQIMGKYKSENVIYDVAEKFSSLEKEGR